MLREALVAPRAEAGFCCPESLNQTDQTRKIFLDFHNDVRRNIALGQNLFNFTSTGRRVVLGPAQNMYRVEWDCNLEQLAAQQIAPCKFPVPVNTSIATNIARWLYFSTDEEAKVLKQIPYAWLISALQYMNGTNRYDSHWAQSLVNIAYWKNQKIGCAYKVCPEQKNMVASCVYGSRKIPLRTKVWQPGETCTCDARPGSFCFDSLCDTRATA
ncbi:SCP-like protein [Teladorsagia circumcincta]|uniref:SCP-like protein n=1 Tax=Teladorsagia circumcincta TaxID=45464 RepID=A0A2G9U9N7_TELCI|nr:SCP-like protein [Teladorsagia circumcincta]